MVEHLLPDLGETDERAVAGYVSGLAAVTRAAVPALPSADLVWLKANLVRRWQADLQVQRSLDVMQSVNIGLGLVAAVVVFVWSAPALLQSLSALRP